MTPQCGTTQCMLTREIRVNMEVGEAAVSGKDTRNSADKDTRKKEKEQRTEDLVRAEH